MATETDPSVLPELEPESEPSVLPESKPEPEPSVLPEPVPEPEPSVLPESEPELSILSESEPPTSVGGEFVNIEGPESPGHQPDLENLVQSISSVDEDRVADDVAAEPEAEPSGGEERKVLPEELAKNVMTLSCESSAEGGICDVYLIGTAHVSQDSCDEVQAVINHLKPQVVFLELCSSRVAMLNRQTIKVPTMGEMVDMWKKQNNMFAILYSWFLAKIGSSVDVSPGSEFRVGFEEAQKYGGKVILGDRPVQITLRRTWARIPRWHKIKLLYYFLFQTIFLPSAEELDKMLKEMNDVDMLTLAVQEMSKEFPTLNETLVHERDQYMSSTLLRVASEHSSVVAVVGRGHLRGIKKYWKQPIELRDLLVEDMPPKGVFSTMRVLTTLGVAVAGAAIVSGIYLSCKK